MKKILITSTQYPYYGGAATNSYALIKYFREQNLKVAGIFFDKNREIVDPDKIGGVWRIKDSNSKKLTKRMVIKYLGGAPDLILAKNYAAPVLSKELFIKSPVAYMVTGSPHMIKLSAEGISAQKYLKSKRKDVFLAEIDAINKSDFVIPNSQLGSQLLIKHYGKLPKIKRPIDTSMALNRNLKALPFNNREYDIAFIVSNLKRSVKNAELAKKIYQNFPNNNKVVIGNNHGEFDSIKNTKTFNALNHQQVMNIINNSKIILCTSYYDASPNIIKEAISCNSNVLLSRNCGWSEIYPKEFVCSDVYDLNEWISKINDLLNKNINFTLNTTSKNLEILRNIKEIM